MISHGEGNAARHLPDLKSSRWGRAVRYGGRCVAAALVLLAVVSFSDSSRGEETWPDEPDTVMFALMSGKCSTLIVAGRNYACRAFAYYQTELGRGNFVVALDDPGDDRHIITFSGENGRRPTDNLYELPVDRMLLKSKDRPRHDGLPVPLIDPSAGMCKQIGNFTTMQVSSVSCSATDRNGKKYEVQFEADGSPISVRRVKKKRMGPAATTPFDQIPE